MSIQLTDETKPHPYRDDWRVDAAIYASGIIFLVMFMLKGDALILALVDALEWAVKVIG